jgi:hypothetical protein
MVSNEASNARFISLEQAFVLFERRNHTLVRDLTNNRRPNQTIDEDVEQENEEIQEQLVEDAPEEDAPEEEACRHLRIRVVSSWTYSIVIYYSHSRTTRCITCGHTETFSMSSGLLQGDEMGRTVINWNHITTFRFIPGAEGRWGG